MTKKLMFLICISLSLIGFTNCSKESSNETTNDNKILGRWVLELKHSVGSDIPYGLTEGEEYTFNSNGTFTGIYIDPVFENGKEVGTKKVPYGGKYQISNDGKKLTIIESGDNPDEYEIYSLTTERLVLRGEPALNQMEAIYIKQN